MTTETSERSEDSPNNIEYNFGENKVDLTLPEDPDVGMEQYETIPVVRKFVQNELQAKRKISYDEEAAITVYEVRGFFQVHGGESFTLDLADYGLSL